MGQLLLKYEGRGGMDGVVMGGVWAQDGKAGKVWDSGYWNMKVGQERTAWHATLMVIIGTAISLSQVTGIHLTIGLP